MRPSRHRASRRLRPIKIVALGAVLFAACQSPTPSQSTPDKPTEVRRHDGQNSDFTLPPIEDDRTSTHVLFALVDALDQGYGRFDLSPPYPNIRIVDPNHPQLPHNAVAVSQRMASGREFIYFDRRFLHRVRTLEPIVMHELAHIKAWRVHGPTIAMHGPEYRSICRSATARIHCTPHQPRPIWN